MIRSGRLRTFAYADQNTFHSLAGAGCARVDSPRLVSPGTNFDPLVRTACLGGSSRFVLTALGKWLSSRSQNQIAVQLIRRSR